MKDSIGKRPTLFANRYMASIVIKLILSFVLFVVIAITGPKPEVIPFGMCFLACYLTFNAFASRQAMKLKEHAS
jgi:hypothetical protein